MKMIGNLAKVHPLKRDYVATCIKVAEENPVITKLIIFGSSVTDECTAESDVDICIEVADGATGQDVHKVYAELCAACDYNCDILRYHKLDTKMKQTVDGKGVSVY